MKPIHIFRVARHTSAGGTTFDFNDEPLRASAEAYDPAVHEAPLLIGHPSDNAPAYGWVSELSFWVSELSFDEGAELEAEPAQVEAQFAGAVADGRFKKVSAWFYTPESAGNPAPGAALRCRAGNGGGGAPGWPIGLELVEGQLCAKIARRRLLDYLQGNADAIGNLHHRVERRDDGTSIDERCIAQDAPDFGTRSGQSRPVARERRFHEADQQLAVRHPAPVGNRPDESRRVVTAA